MQIELSKETLDLLRQQVTRDGLSSTEEAIERAVRFYDECCPTMDSLNDKLQQAHSQFLAGEVVAIDSEDVKQRGRERMAEQSGL